MQTVFKDNAVLFFKSIPQGLGATKCLQLFGVNNVQDFLSNVVPSMATFDFVIVN